MYQHILVIFIIMVLISFMIYLIYKKSYIEMFKSKKKEKSKY